MKVLSSNNKANSYRCPSPTCHSVANTGIKNRNTIQDSSLLQHGCSVGTIDGECDDRRERIRGRGQVVPKGYGECEGICGLRCSDLRGASGNQNGSLMSISIRRNLKDVVGERRGLPKVKGAGIIVCHRIALSGGQRRGARETQEVSES